MPEVNKLGRPMPELGKVEQVDVRGVWPHEAHDFTPWMELRLNLLGDALGMELDLIQREAAVGPFSLDILAQNRVTGEKVAIENQLEWTDHIHLGQIILYAAGCDARTVIWVTPHFQEEHRAAIDWLNRWTSEEIAFYGVEVSAIKIGDSLPAPVFRPVAFPNDWSRGPQTRLPDEEMRFYVSLSKELLERGFADKVYKYHGTPHLFPSGLRAYTTYGVDLGKGLSAYIWINAGSGAATNRIFDTLHEDKEAIETNIQAEWFWDRFGNRAWASIGIRTDGSLDDLPERSGEFQAWALEHLPKLKAVLNPRLEPIIDKVQAERSAADDAPEADPDA